MNTAEKKKARMFLDVDGVLNVPRWGGNQVKSIPLPFFPTDATKEFMHWAWESFDVIWCTCWFDHANLVAKWADLPPRPVLHDRERGKENEDWKVREIRKVVGKDPAHFLFVEDQPSREAKLWFTTDVRLWLLDVDPTLGINSEVLARMKTIFRDFP